jgi:hypothetical protein
MEAETTKTTHASWPLYLIGALFFVGVLSVIAWNFELPYLAYSAGPVSDAADVNAAILEHLDEQQQAGLRAAA